MSKPETVAVSPIPAGLHTVTPRLVVGDGAAAITFYRQAFGAEERPGHRSTWATRSAASSRSTGRTSTRLGNEPSPPEPR